MGLRIREVIRGSIRFGRNRYEIAAVPIDEFDYQGEWRCPLCDRGGQSANKHRRTAAALEWARNCVSVHDAVTHSD